MVILTRNELEYTQRCIASIRAHTPEPYELILVDNGSTDGTLEYLRGLPDATVIANETNLGFGAGCNQGIARSRGDRILLLNNDTVVTEGWLSAMHAALDSHPTAGIAGPRSNHVAGVQKIDNVAYDVQSLDGLEEYARSWVSEHHGSRTVQARLIGFCMLIRREVFDRIGGFDLRFGLGNFEDDDICIRAGVAGFECVSCDDAFVHHFGSRTFVGSKIDHSEHMHSAWDRFVSKWHAQPITSNNRIVGYDAWPVIRATPFDAARHYSPMVATPSEHEQITMQTHPTAVLLLPDRWEPVETESLLAQSLRQLAQFSDVTAVIRIDPSDQTTMTQLEHVADELGDALPDIVVVEHRDTNDCALASACSMVVTHGRAGFGTASIARSVGTLHASVAQLSDRLAVTQAA